MDVRTIFLSNTLVSIYLCIVMIVYARSQKTYPGFRLWMACNFVLVGVYGLYALRGIIPLTVAIVVPNTMLVVSCVLRLMGTKKFLGRSPVSQWHWVLVLFLGSLFFVFSFLHDKILIRVLLISLVMSCYSLYLAFIIYSERHQGGKKEGLFLFAAFLLLVHSILLGIRAVSWWVSPVDRTFLEPTYFNAVSFQLNLIFDIGWTTVFIMLNSQRVNLELLDTRSQLEEIAYTDPLTGLLNRRRFYEEAEREIKVARRTGRSLSLILMDFDDFKQVNDKLGHAAGDRVLFEVSGVLVRTLRPSDRLVRFGGDEFAVLLPETDMDQAYKLGKRLRRQLINSPIEWRDHSIEVSLSMGIASYDMTDTQVDHLLQRADTSLYEVKNSEVKGHTIIRSLDSQI